MYLVMLKTLLTDAMRQVFDADYPEPDFRDLWVDIEFPVAQANYPGIWVGFEPSGQLQVAGVGHVEYTDSAEDGATRQGTRWNYQGFVSFTIVALTSLERDRLFDEVVRILAFGREQPQLSEFRSYIESNDLVACNFDFDQIGVTGEAANPGAAPWDGNEIIYEITVRMECFGEFVNDVAGATLVPLSAFVVTAYSDTEPDPSPEDDGLGAWT